MHSTVVAAVLVSYPSPRTPRAFLPIYLAYKEVSASMAGKVHRWKLGKTPHQETMHRRSPYVKVSSAFLPIDHCRQSWRLRPQWAVPLDLANHGSMYHKEWSRKVIACLGNLRECLRRPALTSRTLQQRPDARVGARWLTTIISQRRGLIAREYISVYGVITLSRHHRI